MTTPRAALVSMGRHFFDTEYARRMHAASVEALRHAGLDLRPVGETITTDEQAHRVSAELTATAPDLIVVQYGTFGLCSHLALALAGTRCPVVLWVVPEPDSPEGRLRLNSMCGANLGANCLYLQKRWFKALYGDPGDARVLAAIVRIALAAGARRILSAARLGLVGEPPEGFYPWSCRDEAVRSRFGVKVVYVPIQRLFELADQAGRAEIEEARAGLPALQEIDRIPPAQVEGSMRISIALNRLADEMALTAAAIRCWPEVPEQRGCAACLGLSTLGGHGVPAACEADLYGAVTLMALSALGGPAPALMDLVAVDGPNAVFWHCGAAPITLQASNRRAMVHPNRKVGLGLDFEFNLDAVTVARFGLDRDGSDRAVVFGGAGGTMPRHFSGTSTAVNVGRPAAGLMEQLFNLGFEHHYGITGSDVQDAFADLCDMLEVPLVRV